MIVGVFLEDFTAHEGGGYTIQGDILNWLLELAEESHHSFVLFCRRPGELRHLLRSSRMSAVAFPGKLTERVVSAAKRKTTVRRSRKHQTRFEEVAHQTGIEFVWFLSAQAIQIDLPYLAIVWDLQHRLQPWFPEVSASGVWDHREAFYSKFLRRAAMVIAGTKAGAQEIQRFYQITEDRIKLLPHPTPTFALRGGSQDGPEVANEFLLGCGLTAGYLLYPAQFWAHKNHVDLLLALKILKEKHQLKLSLVFVGSDKGNQGYVKKLSDELGLVSQVYFLGFVSETNLVALYRNALALTYVSFFGPENLPPLEAFALSCPVIAANVSGAEEQLGDAAILVDPRKPEEMAEAIKLVHDDAATRSTLIERGKERAMTWTGKEFIRTVFSILDEFEAIRRCWPM